MNVFTGFVFTDLFAPGHLFPPLSEHFSVLIWWLAAIDEEVDVLLQMQNAWNNFIESGQIWALLIGLVLGYLFRSLTAY